MLEVYSRKNAWDRLLEHSIEETIVWENPAFFTHDIGEARYLTTFACFLSIYLPSKDSVVRGIVLFILFAFKGLDSFTQQRASLSSLSFNQRDSVVLTRSAPLWRFAFFDQRTRAYYLYGRASFFLFFSFFCFFIQEFVLFVRLYFPSHFFIWSGLLPLP